MELIRGQMKLANSQRHYTNTHQGFNTNTNAARRRRRQWWRRLQQPSACTAAPLITLKPIILSGGHGWETLLVMMSLYIYMQLITAAQSCTCIVTKVQHLFSSRPFLTLERDGKKNLLLNIQKNKDNSRQADFGLLYNLTVLTVTI